MHKKVCVYVRMNAFVCQFIHISANMYVCVCMCVRMWKSEYVCVYVYIYVHMCRHAYAWNRKTFDTECFTRFENHPMQMLYIFNLKTCEAIVLHFQLRSRFPFTYQNSFLFEGFSLREFLQTLSVGGFQVLVCACVSFWEVWMWVLVCAFISFSDFLGYVFDQFRSQVWITDGHRETQTATLYACVYKHM